MLQPLERPSGQMVESKAACLFLCIAHLYYVYIYLCIDCIEIILGRFCNFELYNL